MTSAAGRISAWSATYVARPLAIALASVLVALACTYPLQQVMSYPFVFLFFAAIMGSAWFGGLIAGLEAVVLSSMAIVYFFMPPTFSMSVPREVRTDLAGFVVCALAVTAISTARRKGERAIRLARDEMEARVKERTGELEQSNREIVERERQLRELTEAIPQQIWRADAGGVLEYGNRHLAEYLGQGAEESAPVSLFDAVHPEDAALLEESWSAARRTRSGFDVQVRVRGAGGHYRWFLIRGNPQVRDGGEVVCWYGVHIDIEEQRRAQEAYLSSQESLSRLSRTMSLAEMAASIAHELNQPLTALVADSQACRRWLTTEPINIPRALATSERIVRECTRAGAVLSRVRSLFVQSEYIREETNLNALIRELVRLVREDAIRHAVAIHLALDETLAAVQIDPVQMQQVLLNLTRNAMEAMADKAGPKELEIRTARGASGEIVVSVQDAGGGLDERVRERIFEPFVTAKRDGIGMGLAICRNIVEAHGGRIWAQSQPVGTVVHFTLPAAS